MLDFRNNIREEGVAIMMSKPLLSVFFKAVISFLRTTYSSNIHSIFPLFMESNGLKKFFQQWSCVGIFYAMIRSFESIPQKTFLIYPENFLDFRLDMNENQGIINFSRYNSKSYASVVLRDSELTFFREREDVAFCPFFFFVLFIHRVAQLKKHVVKFSCLLNSRKYFVEVCSFSAFNFGQYCVKFFFCKQSGFDVKLTIDNF